MSTAVVTAIEQSTVVRYEALMRISNAIRARTESEELFDILVDELGKVIQFDAIARHSDERRLQVLVQPVRGKTAYENQRNERRLQCAAAFFP